MGGFGILPLAALLTSTAVIGRRFGKVPGWRLGDTSRQPELDCDDLMAGQVAYADELERLLHVNQKLQEGSVSLFGFWSGLSIGGICGFWLGYRFASLLQRPFLNWFRPASLSPRSSSPPHDAVSPESKIVPSGGDRHHRPSGWLPPPSPACRGCAAVPPHPCGHQAMMVTRRSQD
eukprot:Gregarina_sp_Poly_1__3982@NODE_21_length_20913_cov_102_783268_g19_i0_p13_GENE_NODE_21_length_20913_cov_102_783268_g19_i0NODE_21_length_20913_cov_102_783268_g19_i0_p13_ORF_typecomplete_len176_score24_28_NODE_21_length_20913_cov_102_783268_g19_i01310913636